MAWRKGELRSPDVNIASFIRRWTGTKQQLAAIVDKQQAVQRSLEATDGQDR